MTKILGGREEITRGSINEHRESNKGINFFLNRVNLHIEAKFGNNIKEEIMSDLIISLGDIHFKCHTWVLRPFHRVY